MIIVRLFGGLGNQLFQYAAGRRLSLMHDTTLKLDANHFQYHKLRSYELEPFCIQQEFATAEEIMELKGTAKRGLARIAFSVGQKVRPYYRRSIFCEARSGRLDLNILKTCRNVYLDGYWQSEKYFADIKDVIRREFVVKYEFDSQNREMANRIAETESVSIHVRRGDYVSIPETNMPLCGLDYYARCVKVISKMVPDPHFYVFSDDREWIVENLRFDYATTFVTHNDVNKGYEDLRLMSMCKHDIIANSSFSWWGAWLNPNANKVVLAPRKWHKDESIDTQDLLPESWISI